MGDRLFIDPCGQHGMLVSDEGEKHTICMEPAVEGKPLLPGKELVHIDIENRNSDGSFRIISRFKTGPSQVATKAYRDNYEAIFSKKAVN